MTNGNLIVQGLWIGGRLSELERLCIRSYCANGHEFHLYHYDELENLPRAEGLRLMDGAEVLPCTAAFRNSYRQLAFFSDHFRWELLRQRGGWWVDMDTVCLRPLDIADDVVLTSIDHLLMLNNAVVKLPRGHFIAEAMANCYEDINRFQPWDNYRIKKRKVLRRLRFWQNPRKRIGPADAGGIQGLTAMVRHFGLEKHIQRVHLFFMLDRSLLDYAFDNTLHDMGALAPMLSQSYTVHLVNSCLGILGIDKDGKFPDNSLYEILKRRYGEAKE